MTIAALLRPVWLLILVIVAAGPARAVEVQRVVTPSGIEAWLVEDHSVPVLSMSFTFRNVGAAYDPAERQGLANMTSALLDEGAGDLDSQAFQKRLADLSITLNFDAGRDNFTGSLRTLSENREEAIRLLALALTRPRFDQEPIARIRDQILISIARRAVDPSRLAYRTWFRLAFGEHPYGRSNEGTAATVRQIERDDFVRFVRGRLARQNLIIGVSGDISARELAPLLDQAFGGLPEKRAEEHLPPLAPSAEAGDVVVVRRPIPQSVAVFGHGGMRRQDPDWYAAMILNYVLGGGGFTSRLIEEVREKRGLAYSVTTSLYPYELTGLVLGQVSTQNDRVAESIQLIRAEWARMVEEELTVAEIDGAKAYLVGSFPISLDSTRRIAATLVNIQEHDLGIDYLDRRKELIEGVTAEDIKRVARRLLDPKALSFVVVGAPVGVQPTRDPPEAS